MLMPPTCYSKSDIDALDDRDKLFDVVDTIVQQNQEISQRLHSLETIFGDHFTPDSTSIDDDGLTIRRQGVSSRLVTDSQILAGEGESSSSFSSFGARKFEIVLSRSPVYTRVDEGNEVDRSCRGSTVMTSELSVLSTISLNDISIIAVFRLPITLMGISNTSGERPSLETTLESLQGRQMWKYPIK